MKKYEFTKFEIKLLGHQILVKETIPNLSKVIAIEVLEKPINILKLRRFLEVIDFFRKYI